MVTQLPTEERWEAVEVIDIQTEYQGEPITDHNGNPQYKLSCKFSWSLYPVNIYTYRENCPAPFSVGTYNALVKRGSLPVTTYSKSISDISSAMATKLLVT